jgi:hypothetical protein
MPSQVCLPVDAAWFLSEDRLLDGAAADKLVSIFAMRRTEHWVSGCGLAGQHG